MGNERHNSEIKEAKYDPVKKAEQVTKVVCKGDLRKYRRFRPAKFYGGIATADCVGCCLRCLFCWSWSEVLAPEKHGRFYSPHQVVSNLTGIARKKGFRQMRISGNEPAIARTHLLKVLELVPQDILFILETNGILLGHDWTFAADLARHENVYVRVSLKGCNEAEFSKLTGAQAEGFSLQLQALENLARAGVHMNAAVMVSFSPSENVKALRRNLRKIDEELAHIEVEELVLYGEVEKRLKRAKLPCTIAYKPSQIPPEQV